MKVKISYTSIGMDLSHNIMTDIYKFLPFNSEINYVKCSVIVLNDDYNTVWVKWGDKYDCDFRDLPITAMCTIADAILRKNGIEIF